ncbi:MAG: bifunctional glutamate--cysteine ligase GshA/glutathione synthetase GshB, partial [Bacteroidales bacterium]
HEKVSLQGLKPDLFLKDKHGNPRAIKDWSLEVIQRIRKVFDKYNISSKDYLKAIDRAEDFIKGDLETVGKKIINEISSKGFIPAHLELAHKYLKDSKAKDYVFSSFQDMELSTQLLMRAAVRRGVTINILDRKENFLELVKGDKKEYVCQATKTSKDNYVSILLMENKVVTKEILSDNNIRVPKGNYYTASNTAKQDFYLFKGKQIVVKPKLTNFGIGINILKENYDYNTFCKVIDFAFSYDSSILIEEFVEGHEYRFFVLEDNVLGVLRRIPANVDGDGVRNIEELIKLKNQDSLRGKGYKTPLEKITLGEVEEMFLAQQDLNKHYVPERGERVFLRENSNISTGGDSVDYTDMIHPSYKKIAVEAMRAVKAKVTGLDMMIQDINKPANNSNYAIIELNFNPAIHIHCHPYKGKNRKINEHLLDFLGF